MSHSFIPQGEESGVGASWTEGGGSKRVLMQGLCGVCYGGNRKRQTGYRLQGGEQEVG
jgi:hypothetical protein